MQVVRKEDSKLLEFILTHITSYLTTLLLGATVSPRGQSSIALSDSSSPAALHISIAS